MISSGPRSPTSDHPPGAPVVPLAKAGRVLSTASSPWPPAPRSSKPPTPAAVVKDEGHTYTGRDTIRRWKNDSPANYSYTSEPFSIAEEAGRIVVASHLAGDFPGSPVDVRFFFVLEREKISELEVIP